MSRVVINQRGTDAVPNAVETVYDENSYAAAREYSSLSRYRDILLIKDPTESDTFAHVNAYRFEIPFSQNDTIINATEATRLDILADKHYGNATFWWVIAMASNITDPFNIVNGQLIRIPPLKALYDDLSILSRR